MTSEIANNDLTPDDIPSPDAEWDEIQEFALTFNGYEFWGSFEKCADMANARRRGSPSEIRTCLFFEQRRWRHFGEDPDAEAMIYIRELVDQIRARVEGSTLA